jgi:cell division protein FtsB
MGYLAPLSWKHKAVVGCGVAVLALCATSAVLGRGGVVDLRRLQAQQAEAEAAAYGLAQRNLRLRDHLERLERDDGYLEKIVRERLGWIRPGEFVYRVTSSGPPSRAADD